jgi:acetyltransferase-like isoleucine patch superfamily enzyme
LKKIKPAIVRIGFGSVENYDFKYSRTVLDIQGKIIFNGKAKIGHGSRLSVHGILEIGDKFQISAESTIICRKSVSFGDNNLISWENIIMDTDHHHIYNSDGVKINEDREILIGDNVWIGCRNIVLKGTEIGNNIVIGSNSTIAGKHTQENSIVAGNPTKIIKENVQWKE